MPRITPNQEELDYLRSIGVIPGASPPAGPPAAPPPPAPPKSEGWVVFLAAVAVILAILVVVYALAFAEDATPTKSLESRLNTIPGEADGVHSQHGHDASEVSSSDATPAGTATPREECAERTQDSGPEAPRYRTLERRVRRLEAYERLFFWTAALIAFCVLFHFLFRLRRHYRRPRQGETTERTPLKRAHPCDVGLRETSRIKKDATDKGFARGVRPLTGSFLPEEPGRSKSTAGQAPAPSYERIEGPQVNVVSREPCPERIGVLSIAGPVRKKNEDACIGWRQGDCEFVVVTDGLGGLAEGGTAARLAAAEAARVLSAAAGVGYVMREPQACIAAAFRYAANALFERAVIPTLLRNGGLRTTLIVVVSTPSDYHWGYMGDGGIWLRRQNGALEKLMTPQKGDAIRRNIVAASLGPVVQGQPQFGTTERKTGDLLLVGTDGVFDRVADSFAEDVAALAMLDFKGRLQQTVEETLRQLASAKDESGFVCDDNLTLALVSNGLDGVGFSNRVNRQTGTNQPKDSLEAQKNAPSEVQST
jgi:serine/threonine protein phosphatase PrpC